jgi:predicted ABC-type ATPase
MFAGPNGSGKSTIKSMVPAKLLGVYLNPDEIQKDIEDRGFLNVRDYDVDTTREEILSFFVNSTLLQKAEMDEEATTCSSPTES